MTERNFNAQFKEIMIGLAAEDERTRRVIECLMFLKSENGAVEEANLAAAVAEYYALEPEDMIRVFDLSEEWAWDGYGEA